MLGLKLAGFILFACFHVYKHIFLKLNACECDVGLQADFIDMLDLLTYTFILLGYFSVDVSLLLSFILKN